MRIGIGTRLAALVALPLVALGATSYTLLENHLNSANRAATVEHGIDDVRALTVARAAVLREQAGVQASLRTSAMGISEELAIKLLHIDVFSFRRTGRAQVDELMATNAAVRDAIDVERIDRARHAADAPAPVPSEISAQYDVVEHDLAMAIDVRLNQLRSLSQGPDPAVALDRSLATVRTLSDIVQFGFEQVMDLSAVWMNVQGDPEADRVALVRTSTMLEVRLADVRRSADPSTQAKIDAVFQSADAVAFAAQTQAASAQNATVPGVEVLGGTIAQGIARSLQLDSVLTAAADAAATEASVQHAQTRHRATQRLLEAMAFAMVILGITTLVARSIRRPLRSLSAQANALREGIFDTDFAPRSGMPEVRDTANALAELTTNLRLVEAQGRALALCDLEAPSLSQTVPGRLGDSLQATFRTLSASIMERERLQQRLTHQATHDALTHVGNRYAAILQLRDVDLELRGAGELRDPGGASEPCVAVIFIDLDDFKMANDTFGHGAGDHILQTVARRMNTVVRQRDFVARLGGDEFMVIARNIESTNDIDGLARRVVDAIAEPILYGLDTLQVRASAGIAFVDPERATDNVLLHADLAMYEAKRRGPGSVVRFDDRLRALQQERESLDAALRTALRDNDGTLRVAYEPMRYFDGRASRHFEARVRWAHDAVHLLGEAVFMPAIENSGLIIELDRWLLRSAIADVAQWRADDEDSRNHVTVNVSSRHLVSGELAVTVEAMLLEANVPPACLTIEISEAAFAANMALARLELQALQAIGVRTTIDRFGVGNTSMTQLRGLPIDELKLDASFVAATTDATELALARTLIDLGHRLGLTVVAECLDAGSQMRAVDDLGCDGVQGLHWGTTLCAEQVPDWALLPQT